MAYTEAGKFNTRIVLKHDIEANWIKAKNFIPLEGEIIIYDADENYSYQRIKVGDGTTKVKDLPFDNIQGDWSQNDETASDYVKNRTHYIETPQGKNVLECSIASHFTWGADSSPNLSAQGVSVNMPTVGEIMHAVVTANGISRRFSGTLLKNSFDEMWIGDASKLSGVRYPGNEGEFDFAFVVAPPSYFECYFPVEGFGTIAEGDIVNIHLYTGDPTVIIHQLDEKFIPDTIARKSQVTKEIEDSSLILLELIESTNEDVSDILKQINKLAELSSLVTDLTPIDLLAKFNAKPTGFITNWPIGDAEIFSLLQNGIKNYSQDELFSLFHFFYNKYNNFKVMPVFKLTPGEMDRSVRSVRLCSTTKIELDSVNAENGSSVDPEFNLMYYIDFSENNTLKINFNYMIQAFEDGTTPEIPWDNLNSSNGIMTITFELLPKSSWL